MGCAADGVCRGTGALLIGGIVGGIILVIGPLTGAALNPARTFGPELVSALAGHGAHWEQFIPVYLIPGVIGAGLAVLMHCWLSQARSEAVDDDATRSGHLVRTGRFPDRKVRP
jgi:glycerol uptake facilitator protein